jgi:phosphate transport system substrate-binding protein
VLHGRSPSVHLLHRTWTLSLLSVGNEAAKSLIPLTDIPEGNTVKITRIGGIAALALAGTLALSSCAANEAPTTPGDDTPAGLSGTIAGSGASSQGKAQEAWQAAIQLANEQLTVDYDGGGSGAGRTAFLEGGVDFAGSDRAFKLDEIAEGGFAGCAADSNIVELPLYISPIAVGFNLDGVDTLNLDAETLANIFSGKISNWNDSAIAALNEGTTFPDLAITPVHRSTNSGTTENFTDYLKKAAPAAWGWDVSGDWPADITGGEAAAETGDVAAALGNVGTIGYLDASRAPGTTAAIKVGDAFVPYSPEGAAAVVDASPLDSGRTAGDLAYVLDRTTTASGAYPLVLISYLVGCEEYVDAAQGALVKAYFSYIASAEGQNAAAEAAGSAPISAQLRGQVEAAIALIK